MPQSFWLRALRKSTAIVAQSEVLSALAANHNIPQCRIIPNGVDTERFKPLDDQERDRIRRSLALPNDRLLIINTGRYDREKNQITLLKAAEEIESKLLPGMIHVVILGATQRNQLTSNESELKQYVADRKLENLVTFVDDAANVEQYLGVADIFVQPTTREGMSNALLEAMASGLAMVCSDIPQNTCVFPDGAGLFFPARDVDRLSAHLVQLTESAELRSSHGKALARYAEEHYSNDILARRYEALLREITDYGSLEATDG